MSNPRQFRSEQQRIAARPVGSHERLGDLAVAAGDSATAEQHYRAGLAIAERLAAADPGNAEYQRDLSISHNKLGELAVASGQPTAEQHYGRPGHRERLAAADPGNAEYQRDLSISHNKLGELAARSGTPPPRSTTRALAIASGWPPPTPATPNTSATCRSATTGSGTWRSRPGTPPPPSSTTAPPWPSPSGWPPPTPATPDTSATCRSATTSSGIWRSRPGTWPPPSSTTAPPWPSPSGWPPPTPATPNTSATCRSATTSSGTWRSRPGTRATAEQHYRAALAIARAAGRRRPRQRRIPARPVDQPQQARGSGGRGRGHGHRRPALPRRPGHRASGWPPPTPATPDTSATCRSATTSSGSWRSRPGTRPPPNQHYRAALAIAERLAAADPGNAEYQRDLSISHNRLGELAVAAGDRPPRSTIGPPWRSPSGWPRRIRLRRSCRMRYLAFRASSRAWVRLRMARQGRLSS